LPAQLTVIALAWKGMFVQSETSYLQPLS